MHQADKPRFAGLERVRHTPDYEMYYQSDKRVYIVYFFNQLHAALNCLWHQFWKLNFHTDKIACGPKVDEDLRLEDQGIPEYHRHVLILQPLKDVIKAVITFYETRDGVFMRHDTPSIKFTRELPGGGEELVPREEYETDEGKYHHWRNRALLAAQSLRDHLQHKDRGLTPARLVIRMGEYSGTVFFETPVPAEGTVILKLAEAEAALQDPKNKKPCPVVDKTQLFELLYGQPVSAYMEDVMEIKLEA